MRRFRCSVRILLAASTLVAVSSLPAAAEPIYALTPGNILIRFDSATPNTVTTVGAVTGLGVNQTLRGIDYRPRTGQLFGVAVTTGSAANSVMFSYRINPLTAVATFVGQTAAALPGAGDVPAGFDANPTVDRLRFVNTNDESARLNPNNGTLAGNDTDLTPAATSTIIAAAYDRNFDRQTIATNGALPTTLYVIDRNDSQLGIQGGLNGTPSPNAGVITDIGSLGFNLNQANDGGFDISPSFEGPRVFAALTNAADNLTRLYTIDLTTGAATSIGLIGNGLTEVRSLAIVPGVVKLIAADAGGWPVVRVLDSLLVAEREIFLAYEMSYRGGGRVAAGDLTGDGMPEIITAPGPGSPAEIRIIDISGPFPRLIGSFLAFDPSFTGGVFVASGDVNGDGFDDLILAPDAGGGPHVRVISGRNGWDLYSFFAYDPSFSGGVRVAAADVNLDGQAEIITVPGPGGPSHVKVFNGGNLSEMFGYIAFSGFLGGAYVAAGDVSGDGVADIITGAGPGGTPHVRVVNGATFGDVANFFAYPADFTGGVRVGAGDWNNDGVADIITGAGPGGTSHVRILRGSDLVDLASFLAFQSTFYGGVFVW